MGKHALKDKLCDSAAIHGAYFREEDGGQIRSRFPLFCSMFLADDNPQAVDATVFGVRYGQLEGNIQFGHGLAGFGKPAQHAAAAEIICFNKELSLSGSNFKRDRLVDARIFASFSEGHL